MALPPGIDRELASDESPAEEAHVITLGRTARDPPSKSRRQLTSRPLVSRTRIRPGCSSKPLKNGLNTLWYSPLEASMTITSSASPILHSGVTTDREMDRPWYVLGVSSTAG